MARLTAEISPELAQQIQRVVKDGWFPDEEAVMREALEQFLGTRTYLGDSPGLLHRFAADALNESKPETALKFVDRGLSLLTTHPMMDLDLYQAMIEMRVQILMVLGRDGDARIALEAARERLPNSPGIERWLQRIDRRG